MSWSHGSDVFDPVATKMGELQLPDEVRYQLCRILIDGLQQAGWACEDESLRDFLHDAAVVRAFAACGIELDEDGGSETNQTTEEQQEPPHLEADPLIERLRQHQDDTQRAARDTHLAFEQASITPGNLVEHARARNVWVNAVQAYTQAQAAYQHACEAAQAGQDPRQDTWVADVLAQLDAPETTP